MDTKALEKAEQAVTTAVAEYEKLVAAETDYKDKIATAKAKALAAAASLRQIRKEMVGSDITSLLGSISTRGRKPGKAQGAPGGAATEGTSKKRVRAKKEA